MNSLVLLYELILENCKKNGVEHFQTCDELLKDYLPQAKKYLQALGYNISNCSTTLVSALLFSLVDIILVVDKKDNFYLGTLSTSCLTSLIADKRLLPRKDETASMEKTLGLIQNLTLSDVNEYLQKGKLHLIKLNHFNNNSAKYRSLFCTASSMKPYPDLVDCKVYPLQASALVFNKLSVMLVTNKFTKIVTDEGSVICTDYSNYNSRRNNTVTSGSILASSVDNTFVEIPIWKIKSFEVHRESSDLVDKLTTGIYLYKKTPTSKGIIITLNQDYILRYYGNKYLNLESIGVRERYALEELMLNGRDFYNRERLIQLYKKYDFFNVESLRRLRLDYTEVFNYLVNQVKSNSSSQYNGLIHARVLGSYNSIIAKRAPYYVTFKVDANVLLEQLNPEDILPKLYYFCGISEDMGYQVIQVNASTDGSAESTGKAEFKYQFGKLDKCTAIYCVKTNQFIKGSNVYTISTEVQEKIVQDLMYGYVEGFSIYANHIRGICSVNFPMLEISDDLIKYAFVNPLAKGCGKIQNISFLLVTQYLVQFLDSISKHKENLDGFVKDCLVELNKPKVISLIKQISSLKGDSDFNTKLSKLVSVTKSTKKGFVCSTPYCEFLLGVTDDNVVKLPKTVKILHQNKEVAVIRL